MIERRVSPDRRATRRIEERQLRSIIEQLADGIVIVSATGVIRFANPAAAHLFARSAKSLVGTEFGFPIVNGHPFEIEVIRPGGVHVTAELRVADVVWEGEQARLVSIRDVTDRRRVEERSRQVERERAARAEAEAANQAKSDFLATMSHELRTPLNAVIGYAQLLELGIGGTLAPEQQQQVNRILTSGHHLLGLVNEVLDLAKVDAGKLTVHISPNSAEETADAAATLIQPSAEAKGVTLTVHQVGGDSVQYAGDEDRVRQILLNLLANAVKFSDGGGSVSLVYGPTPQPDPEARLPDGGQWVFFRVEDNGIGIPPDQLTRIFEPFVQANPGRTRVNDGSGLGLAISRRLARLMNGDITVRSTPGAGSAFTLWLPFAERSDDLTAGPPAQSTSITSPRVAHVRGLGEIGEILLRETVPLMETFVARLRTECPAPGATELKFSQIADHAVSYVSDLASMLIAVEETGGQPSSLFSDATDIHRLIAGRHGAQRARLGWTESALRCEYRILREEIGAVVRRRAGSMNATVVEDALAIMGQLLLQSEQTSIRALKRVVGREEGR